MTKTLAIDSDNLVELVGLTLQPGRTKVSDATVTFTLRTAALQAVSGATSIAMTHTEDDSEGTYAGVLENTVVLTDGTTYWLDITATADAVVGFWRIPCVARYQGG